MQSILRWLSWTILRYLRPPTNGDMFGTFDPRMIDGCWLSQASNKNHQTSIWLAVFRPTPLKNHGVSSSVGAGFSIPNWMESHEIPWFQSPPTSGTWPKFLGSTTMYIVSLSLGENPFLNSDDIARLNVGWKIHLFPTFDTGEYWEYHDNSPYIPHFGWS